MKNWNTRLREIKTTIRETNVEYAAQAVQRVDTLLNGLTQQEKKDLSAEFHLSKQKTRQDRKYIRAIAFLERAFDDHPRSVAAIVADLENDLTFQLLSELKKRVKRLDPDAPRPPDLARHRPLLVGCSISGGEHPGPGSIGCFVICNRTERPMILGNEHVMRAEFGIDTDEDPEIRQPSKGNGGSEEDRVALYDRGLLDARIDAAVAYLYPDVPFANRTLEGVSLLGTCATFNHGDPVWKRGTASRRTEGRIKNPSAAKGVPHARFGGTIDFTKQIEVEALREGVDFQIPGDSGSVLVNDDNEIIGLMHGGGKGGGIATPIGVVFDLLDVRLAPAEGTGRA
ncbi:MAG: hypothetical protein R3247_12550 [Rhodothermales bacterium]|nr:hypothetical protein [Rhodothermales bacterium]